MSEKENIERSVDKSLLDLLTEGGVEVSMQNMLERAGDDLIEAREYDPLVAAIANMVEEGLCVSPAGIEDDDGTVAQWLAYTTLLARELLRANRILHRRLFEKQALTTPELLIVGEDVQTAVAQMLRGRKG